MRLFVGGDEVIVPARWYWCARGAQRFPFAHGAESSVWLSNYEINHAWGEVTPFPTDPNGTYRRGLDRGLNPGYPGQCFVGQPQWFIDGQLPANFFDGVPQPLPACCKIPPTLGSGGLLVQGDAVVPPFGSGGLRLGGSGRGPARSSGGLVLGGSAVRPVATSSGGLVLGGSAGPGPASASGGLVLGGSATSGGTCDNCPGGRGAATYTALFSGGTGDFAVFNGSWTMRWLEPCVWSVSRGTAKVSMQVLSGFVELVANANGVTTYIQWDTSSAWDCATPLSGDLRLLTFTGSGTPPVPFVSTP